MISFDCEKNRENVVKRYDKHAIECFKRLFAGDLRFQNKISLLIYYTCAREVDDI